MEALGEVTRSPFVLPKKRGLGWLTGGLERLLGLRRLHELYQTVPPGSVDDFLENALAVLGVRWRLASGTPACIPETGSVLVVANHPFGGIDGIVLAQMLRQRRPDVKILTNAMLGRITELSELFLPVDVLSSAAQRDNARGLRAAYNHLDGGGLLLLFPAGQVAALQLKARGVVEPPWNPLLARLCLRTQPSVVPVFIEGCNSALFQAAGLLHKRLRTALLPRQLLNKNRAEISVRVGQALPPKDYEGIVNPRGLTDFLRLHTFLLSRPNGAAAQSHVRSQQQLAAAALPARQEAELATLPARCLLDTHRDLRVYCASAAQLPVILPELGRLRELSFRGAGEGTGRPCDLDRFDAVYRHLFVWDSRRKCIAGAYRIGFVDQLIAAGGVTALYTRSLFRYNRAFLDNMGGCIEMGRSFVHPDYQRSLGVLNLLWRGIGRLVSDQPRYHTLFGPVSISADYSHLARQLMFNCLTLHYYDDANAATVRPVKPFRAGRPPWTRDMLKTVANGSTLSRLISRMEGGRGLPVLLRQYLNLNGRFVCFNVDPTFGNTLVGLVVVDLRRTPRRFLKRFLTPSGMSRLGDAADVAGTKTSVE